MVILGCAQLRQYDERHCALERRSAGVGQCERLAEVFLCLLPLSDRRSNLSEEPVSCHKYQGLARLGCLGHGQDRMLLRQMRITGYEVVTSPEPLTLRSAAHGSAP